MTVFGGEENHMRVGRSYHEGGGSRLRGKLGVKALAFGVITGVMLAVGMLVVPQTAMADPAGSVLIDESHTLDASNPMLSYGGGTITFDANTGTLTLDRVTIDDQEPSEVGATNSSIRVTTPGDLTIVLKGDNYLGGSGYGIFANVDSQLLITGDGTLTIEKDEYAISTFDADLTIDGCRLNLIAGDFTAIESLVAEAGAKGSITIRNGADVSVAARSERGWYAIHAEDDITITDSTLTVTLSGGKTNVAMWAENGTLTIDNSTVISQSNASYGLYGGEVIISGSSHVYATGSDGASVGLGSDSTIEVESSWVQSTVGVSGELSSSNSVVIAGNEGTAAGDVVVSGSVEVPAGVTLTIPEGATVTVPAGAEFVNNGSIVLEGSFVSSGGKVTCASGSHAGGAASCEKAARCALCGLEYGSALGHDWGKPEWSWSEDGTKFVATFVCAHDAAHTQELTAEPTSSVQAEPTCTEAGVRVYTATVELDGTKYTATSEQAIPALGHDFQDGVCTRCEAVDPDYVAPQDPVEDETALPAAGDASAVFSLAPAFVGAGMLAARALVRHRR